MPAIFIKRNPKKEHSFETIDLDTYKITRPAVFCFSGNATLETSRANGMCKIAEHELRLLFDEKTGFNLYDNIDLIGVVYEQQEAKNTGIIDDKSREKFVNKLLCPLCVDKDGKLFDVDTICKNLSLVTFFTFCHGAKEVCNLLFLFSKNVLKDLPYEDVARVLSSIMNVSYSPDTRFVSCPSIILTSAQDPFSISEISEYEDALGEINGIDIVYNNAYESLRGSDKYKYFPHIHIYSSRLNNGKDKMFEEEHHIRLLDRNKDWENYIQLRSGERLDFGSNADAISQMTSYALCASVENGLQNLKSATYIPKQPLLDTYYDLQSIKKSFDEQSLLSF